MPDTRVSQKNEATPSLIEILEKKFGTFLKVISSNTKNNDLLRPDQKIHHCVGVYSSGDKIHNGVLSDDLNHHIEYCKTFRPGRAIFVDGKCIYRGYLTEQECVVVEKELQESSFKITKVTRPYA